MKRTDIVEITGTQIAICVIVLFVLGALTVLPAIIRVTFG